MRLNDLNDGSIKTFLVLTLLAGNIAAVAPRTPGSASPAVSRASRDTLPREEPFREGPALPAQPSR